MDKATTFSRPLPDGAIWFGEKSSLLAASVLPKLAQLQPAVHVLRLRGLQDPVSTLNEELLRPGQVWQRPPQSIDDCHELVERACRQVKPRRLLIVFDQFEDFVILHDKERQKQFQDLLAALAERPVDGLTLLLVLRSDYIGLLENLPVPKLVQNTNWKDVPPFTESEARDFLLGSGLKLGDELMRSVLKEATEIEQTKGLIRPITINLCGLVLGRFATGLPAGFRPGSLIRGFLRGRQCSRRTSGM